MPSLTATLVALAIAPLCGASLLSWDEAYVKADKLLPQMTQDEKYSLMHGVGWYRVPFVGMGPLKKWWYAGNTPPVSRLGIPSLNMQDAAGGFRDAWTDNAGTATCWPSLLAAAATWDVNTVREFAVALGEEFSGKGANAILGPSINVHRVARNGRNFEYLSGEDPYLGARLTEAYVQGVQSTGVASVMKHWVFNSQETNRHTQSSNVDDRTAWEIYYPPFQAAIEAGVSVAMCSYNKIDGTPACGNKKHLSVLKDKLGFRGFVQSDWYATHSTSIKEGLDQEMPGTSRWFAPEALAGVNGSLIDGSVRRILAAMYHMDLFNSTKTSAPAKDWVMKDVKTEAHKQLARKTATESVVLLQNNGQVLPITNKTVRTIAIVGSPADAKNNNPWGPLHWFPGGDYYSGGGSGHVTAVGAVSALKGIQERATQAGIKVNAKPTDNVKDAVKAAEEADLTIVVAATTSREEYDRTNLNLDNDADALIDAVAKAAKRTVVIAQVPGAVVMPWRNSVDGIAVMFLAGQETGSAWASVLFGDHAPTGHLPVMIPASESDSIPPSDADDVNYDEGMATSYRNPNFTAAFPFGHGLTYSSFEYGKLSVEMTGTTPSIHTKITNTGKVSASTVAQLYVEFPAAAKYPALMLKGFQKTPLIAPGAAQDVTFTLSDRDVSYYTSQGWTKAGSVVVHVGASSGDIKQSMPVILEKPDLVSVLI